MAKKRTSTSATTTGRPKPLRPGNDAGWARLARSHMFQPVRPPKGSIGLNAGTLSPTPKPVFQAVQALRQELATRPSPFLWHRQPVLLQQSRKALAGILGCDAGNLLLVPNATWAMNLAATATRLASGDEVVITDHEYGACTNPWQRQIDEWTGEGGPPVLNVARIPHMPATAAALIEAVWQHVTPRTRVLHISHINFTTGLVMPVEELCSRARAAGIVSYVDGSHAPGAIPVKRAVAAADFYVANCHKWLMCPAGCGFLHVQAALREKIRPVITSWGYGHDPHVRFNDSGLGGTVWQWSLEFHGTDDRTAQMVVPQALAVRGRLGGDKAIIARTRHLSDYLRREMAKAGFAAATPAAAALSGGSLTAFEVVPSATDPRGQVRFRDMMFERGIEAPATSAGGRTFLRVSTPWYVPKGDLDALVKAAVAVYARPSPGALPVSAKRRR